jgi:hypothetical protein
MAEPNSTDQPMAVVAPPVLPCCPPLETDNICDVIDFDYRLIHNTTVQVGDQRRVIPVEVKTHVHIERCTGPLVLGDLAYSTTLLPGEKVRLFTTDRRTRFTFDSSTQLSYRNEQTSEEHFYISSFSDFMSDVNVRDASRSSNTSRGSFQTHAETSSFLSDIFSSPSVDVNGSYNASSTSEFLRELSQHVRASDRRSEMGSRGASTISIGEVQTRSHAEGQSEDHFESSSREFSNQNKCHAVTFFFYRINKTQTVKVTLESIERRVIDPAAETKVTNNTFESNGDVSVIPSAVLATDKQRLEIEQIGRESGAAEQGAVTSASFVGVRAFSSLTIDPIPGAIRQRALLQVDQDLVEAGLLDKVGGEISPQTQEQFSFERHFSLPTPGVIVKGCLDDCDVCESSLLKEIELDLQRKDLENQLLKRQIELLDKSQEYRCCPDDEDEDKS